MAISVQALTINWGSGGQVSFADGTGGSTLYEDSGYVGGSVGLFYLGNISDTLLTAGDLNGSMAWATNDELGYDFLTQGSTFTIKTSNFANYVKNGQIVEGDVFAVFFIYDNGMVSDFYTDDLLSSVYDGSWTAPVGFSDTTTCNIYANASGAFLTPPGDLFIPPVPEPATALLAFAGLAMMICRRKKQK